MSQLSELNVHLTVWRLDEKGCEGEHECEGVRVLDRTWRHESNRVRWRISKQRIESDRQRGSLAKLLHSGEPVLLLLLLFARTGNAGASCLGRAYRTCRCSGKHWSWFDKSAQRRCAAGQCAQPFCSASKCREASRLGRPTESPCQSAGRSADTQARRQVIDQAQTPREFSRRRICCLRFGKRDGLAHRRSPVAAPPTESGRFVATKSSL